MPLGPGNSDGCQRVILSDDTPSEVFFTELNSLTGPDGVMPTIDKGPFYKGSRGLSGAAVNSADMSGAVANVTDAPTAGQILIIDDIVISTDTALRFDFTCEDSATVLLRVYMPANSTLQLTLRNPIRLPTADKQLQARTSAAGNVSILTSYHSEVS